MELNGIKFDGPTDPKYKDCKNVNEWIDLYLKNAQKNSRTLGRSAIK